MTDVFNANRTSPMDADVAVIIWHPPPCSFYSFPVYTVNVYEPTENPNVDIIIRSLTKQQTNNPQDERRLKIHQFISIQLGRI